MKDELSVKLAMDVPGIGKEGDRVSLALTPSDVHDPTEMTTYLAGYKPFGFRADEVSPPILVDKDEDKYRTFSSDDAFRRVTVKGSLTSAVPEVDPKSSLTNYKVIDRFIGGFVGRITQQQPTNPNYDPIMAVLRRCSNALYLDREIDVMNLVGTAANWDSSVRTAIAGSSEWDTTNGDPIKDLQTAIELSWQPVTEIWMNQKCGHTFFRNTNVRNQMRQLLGDGAAPDAVANIYRAGTPGSAPVDVVIPGLPPIKIIASKAKNESTGALDYTLSSDVAVLAHRPPGVPQDGEDIASTYTFRRRGPGGQGVEVRQYPIEGRGPYGGTMVVVAMADVAVMTGTVVGGIVTNTLSTV